MLSWIGLFALRLVVLVVGTTHARALWCILAGALQVHRTAERTSAITNTVRRIAVARRSLEWTASIGGLARRMRGMATRGRRATVFDWRRRHQA